MGFGALALGGLDGAMRNPRPPRAAIRLLPRTPHFPAKAKHVIHLFMNGGPSHVDTFDPKPLLDEVRRQAAARRRTCRPSARPAPRFPSPFKFRKYGQSGIEVSELFPHVAAVDRRHLRHPLDARRRAQPRAVAAADELRRRPADPAQPRLLAHATAWAPRTRTCPAFVAMCPGGYPIQESQNWQAGFLPGVYQGTYIDTQHTDDREADRAHPQRPRLAAEQREQLDLLQQLNAPAPAKRASTTPQLEARIQSFELAFRMQTEAADAFDVSREPQHIRDMYGPGVAGPADPHRPPAGRARRALRAGLARRTASRGTTTTTSKSTTATWPASATRRSARCSTDLKQRGLLDETLVIWGGEFGRTPDGRAAEAGLQRRARSTAATTTTTASPCGWPAAACSGGYVHGATDEFGFKAVENRVHVHDLHATILHLLGFDHEKFTYRYAGRDFRLTDVHGHVVTRADRLKVAS